METMAGKGPGQIATILKKDEVPTPNYYNYLKYGRSHPFLDMDHPYSWASTTINAILKSQTYIGHYAACRDTLISYKNKKRVKLPEDQWVITKNTHEPLVTQDGKKECSGHRIRVDELEMIVLDDLCRVTHFARMKEKQFAEHINQKNSAEARKEINALNKDLTAMQKAQR